MNISGVSCFSHIPDEAWYFDIILPFGFTSFAFPWHRMHLFPFLLKKTAAALVLIHRLVWCCVVIPHTRWCIIFSKIILSPLRALI